MKKIHCIMVASLFLASLTFSASATAPAKTITVTGKVVDSVTSDSINGATVMLSVLTLTQEGELYGLLATGTPTNALIDTLLHMNLKIDTVYTDVHGAFSHQMQIDPTDALIGCVAAKPGYQTGYGIAFITNYVATTSVTVSTIKLKSNSSGILAASKPLPAQVRANNMTIYSLRGQQLYSGPVAAIDLALKNQRGPVIVNFRHNTATVDSRLFTGR